MPIEFTEHESYTGEKELQMKVTGCDYDLDIRIEADGTVEIEQDGHGGYQCCDYHTSRFPLRIADAVRLRDWLDHQVIDRRYSCDHLRRVVATPRSDKPPHYACPDCGYGT